MNRKLMLSLYEKMILDRYLEERMQDIYQGGGKILTSLHLGLGHEALSIGSTMSLQEDDYLVFSHRGMGHSIGKGMPIKALLAEWYGKATGCSKGKGGVHLSDFSRGILGISGSQGGNAVIAVGAALSSSLQKTDQVTMCFFGEGTSNRGPVHEAMNMAAVWRLPVIFVCENDGYSFSTHASKVLPIEHVADRGSAYNIPGVVVDGNDVLAVYRASARAVERARAGEGPTLIEGKTYRFCGHHEKDTHLCYRQEGEILDWKKKCPIHRFEGYLREKGIGEKELLSIQDKVKEEIEEAVNYAEESPFPKPKDLYLHVYADPKNLLEVEGIML